MRKHIVIVGGVECSLPESFARSFGSGLWYNYANNEFYTESDVIATYRIR